MWRWRFGPGIVFWAVNILALCGVLTSVASVAVRFQAASERFAQTSDSLDSLASASPQVRISFEKFDEFHFDTKKAADSQKSLTKGSWYLILAVPTDWEDAPPGNTVCDAGELPYQLSGRQLGTDTLSSGETAKFWGWKDKSIPATPEGNVESEMNLVTKLFMNLFAPFRQSATLPWFQLMGHMENAPDHLIPVGSSVMFRAPVDGTLTLYVNDVPGLYCNNSGTARIRIYECGVAESADSEQADTAE